CRSLSPYLRWRALPQLLINETAAELGPLTDESGGTEIESTPGQLRLNVARLHLAPQRVADRRWRPRQIAEKSVVFGQEPGRQSCDQRARLAAAIPCSRLIAARWRLRRLPWPLWR